MCIEIQSTCKRWRQGRSEDLVVESLREGRSSCGCTSLLSLYPAATPCTMFKLELSFLLLLFEHRSIFKYYCSAALNFLVRYCSGMANNF